MRKNKSDVRIDAGLLAFCAFASGRIKLLFLGLAGLSAAWPAIAKACANRAATAQTLD